MFGAEDRVKGPVATTLTPESLSRLYGLSLQIVDVPGPPGSKPVRGIVPLFGRARLQ
jgi:hypothetical protein